MSRRLALVVMSLTSLLGPAAAQNVSIADTIADLLLQDEIQQAESLLNKQPRTAQNVAFRGEIEFRNLTFTYPTTVTGTRGISADEPER